MNSRLVSLVLFVSMLVLATTALAQNRFFEDGTSGFHVVAGLQSTEDAWGPGAAFSYTVESKFDFGLALTRSYWDENDWGQDFRSITINPYFAANIVRPDTAAIVGLDFSLNYGTSSYSGDFLDAMNWDMSSKGFSMGFDGYLELQGSPTLMIYPGLGLAYMKVKGTIEDNFGNEEYDTVVDALITAEVSFLFNEKIYVMPSVSNFDGDSTWALMVGFLFPKK